MSYPLETQKNQPTGPATPPAPDCQ